MINNIDLEEGWRRIEIEVISKLISSLELSSFSGFTLQEFSELYTLIYNMSTQRTPQHFSYQLYDRFTSTFREHMISNVKPIFDSNKGLDLLMACNKFWSKFQVMKKWMLKFFSYLDRHHVNQNDLPSLSSQTETVYIEEIWNAYQFRIISACVQAYQEDRQGTIQERKLIKSVTSMFIKPESLQKLETEILEETSEFYHEVSAEWGTSFTKYTREVQRFLKDDKQRATECLGENFASQIEKTIIQATIHHGLIYQDDGIRFLIQNCFEEDLERAYNLYSKLENGLTPLANELTECIKEVNVQNSKGIDSQVIDQLIEVLAYYKRLVQRCFNNDIIFYKAIKRAFEVIMNRSIGNCTITELLARFADKTLTKSSARRSEEQIEEHLVNIMDLFENIEDKDFFCEVYRTLLANRLLNNSSTSEDAEKSFISKLKSLCGSHYTSKLEGILYDLHLAQDIQKQFSGRSLSIEFSAKVLTLSHWPTYRNPQFECPPVMNHCMNTFDKFYKSFTAKRKLVWMKCLGTATVRGSFANSKHDFVCTTYQASLLCLFNQAEKIKFEDIKGTLKCDSDTCKQILLSLMTKHKLLDGPRKFTNASVFSFRHSYTSNMRNVTLPVPHSDNLFSKQNVLEDRNLAIEATIIRVLKNRKTLSHVDLINEILHLLVNFKPQVKDIKARIENLIAREFIRRDQSDAKIYHYIA